jgi:3-oxoacyl-[acyl-carrier-protein] synthase II
MAFGIKGGCQTIIGSRTSGLDALRLAALRIAAGQRERMIVSAGEEQASLVNEAYGYFGMHHGGRRAGEPFSRDGRFATGCGAVTLILESEASLRQRGGKAQARLGRCLSAACGADASVGSLIALGRRQWRALGDVSHVIASANGTFIDAIERAVLRPSGATVASMSGHIAETFSVNPLAAIAATILTGRLPALRSAARLGASLSAARGDETPEAFAVLATDYNGALAAALVSFARDYPR